MYLYKCKYKIVISNNRTCRSCDCIYSSAKCLIRTRHLALKTSLENTILFKKIKNLIIRYACPTGWTYNNQACYLRVDDSTNWNSANTYCQAQDPKSYLATISTDFDYLKTFVNSGTTYWVKLFLIKLKLTNFKKLKNFLKKDWSESLFKAKSFHIFRWNFTKLNVK